MITLLTPSKTMDFDHVAPSFVRHNEPFFSAEAKLIQRVVACYDVNDLMELMRISRPLAEKVQAMYQLRFEKPALWTYRGDVFKGFQADTLDQPTASFAQDHLLIASAVYGVLRPYDLISPYRLEMKTKLLIDESISLYDFWGPRLASHIVDHPYLDGELCVLSSEEYSKAITGRLPSSVRIITPAFIDRKSNGVSAQIPIYNKMMRGAMARWIADRRLDSSDRLYEFSGHGYHYNKAMSTPERPVYYRQQMRPLRFT